MPSIKKKMKYYPETPISPLFATYFGHVGAMGVGCSCGSFWVFMEL